jgi:hypothetical protein
MQEHDIGRGLPGFTQLVNLTGNGGRDNQYVTKAPSYTNSCFYKYTFISSQIPRQLAAGYVRASTI